MIVVLELPAMIWMVAVKTAFPDTPASQLFLTSPPTWVVSMNPMKILTGLGVGHGLFAGWIVKVPLPCATPSLVRTQICTPAVVAVVTLPTVHWSEKLPLAGITPVPFAVPPFAVLPPIVTSMWTSASRADSTLIVCCAPELMQLAAMLAENCAASAGVAPSPTRSPAAPLAASSRFSRFIPFLLYSRA